jgi:hypothetical protein
VPETGSCRGILFLPLVFRVSFKRSKHVLSKPSSRRTKPKNEGLPQCTAMLHGIRRGGKATFSLGHPPEVGPWPSLVRGPRRHTPHGFRRGNTTHPLFLLQDARLVLRVASKPLESLSPNLTSKLEPNKTKKPNDYRLPKTIEIWLILPVVICLFQGLSHACLRITALQESAHGSLHQTQSAAKMLRFSALLDTLAKRQANT